MIEEAAILLGHLNDSIKGIRSKTFPASLTGVLWTRFFKTLKCYIFSNLRWRE